MFYCQKKFALKCYDNAFIPTTKSPVKLLLNIQCTAYARFEPMANFQTAKMQAAHSSKAQTQLCQAVYIFQPWECLSDKKIKMLSDQNGKGFRGKTAAFALRIGS